MIKKYEPGDNTQLSPHFNVQEFKCKCRQPHDILIAEELVDNLEKLYSALNCSKIIVTSGYRCVAHDKNVGGSGSGQHTKGNAADICCYGQDGQPISSKTVCCKAQDIGFGGIANITTEYKYTHVDVRTGSKWYGDETKGNSAVTSDFYSYFGVSKNNEPLMKGIDVSVHNGDIDWQKVKNSGIQFAILRAGYGREMSQKDVRFEENYRNAKAAGIPVGAYWYSYAMTPEEAELEADVFLKIIDGKQFEMPVYFDLEEKKQFDLGKEKVSAIMRAFLEKVEKAGYFVGLYGSASSLTTHTAYDIKFRYTIWLAHWTQQINYSGNYGIWQYSSEGKVDGISGNVDLDICYKDFPMIIKAKGLNGFGKEEVVPNPSTPDAEDGITIEVNIEGKKYSGKLNQM
ncbi:MAG: D-Ala-D-Ala carboxypeptidase family metallohydrolase [Ruminococcus flavefaciens]|nr:D-Ala-D-Ala carboxypeptidase family metallohydrolase [Ruminococcus flavefaciens]MCM1362996.1 D-Ala-D-Ala carboxypeptidase family metallohydrolase [Clostridiales bacterium]